MKKLLTLAAAAVILAFYTGPALAYGDKGSDYEHKSDENKEAVQDVMTDYIEENSTNGVFSLDGRNMTFIELHDNVGMKGGMHYSCADFKDNATGETIDVDIFVDVDGDDIEVSKAKVHKVDGKKVGAAAKDAGSKKGSDHDHDHDHKGSGY